MKKVDELHILVTHVCADIIFICETWLCKQHNDSLLGLRNFTIFRRDRDHGNDPHGGVIIAVRQNLNPMLIHDDASYEILFVDITVDHQKIRLCVCYRPSMNIADTVSFLSAMKLYSDVSQQVCIVGDFNIPCIDWTDNTATDSTGDYLLEFVNELGLHQFVHEPTREHNILDLIFCNRLELVSNVTVHESFSSGDHSYLTFELEVRTPNRSGKPYANYKAADWDLMRAHLATIDWNDFFTDCADSCEVAWSKFRHLINTLVELYVPTNIAKNGKNAPWYNDTLKRMTRTKQRKWHKYKRSKLDRDLREYRSYCKQVQHAVKRERALYEIKKFKDKSHKAKEFFRYIDNRTSFLQTVPTLKIDSNDLHHDDEKCEALNNYYSTVFTRDNGVIPDCHDRMSPNSFTNIVIDDRCIVEAVNKLNIDGAPGIDNISPLLLKKVLPYLVKPLRYIFTLSLTSGIVPSDWKQGIICPIYKNNGKPNDCSSYRPICLTSVVCKVLEHIIRKQITEYLNLNNLISPHQHGFLSRRSTTTNLLDCLNNWTKTVDEKDCVDVAYIDMAKAFDTVSHCKFLYKLSLLGIGGEVIAWIKSFLLDRSQCVRVGTSFSSMLTVLSGIPQGTVLGALFFILYIDDLCSEVSHSNITLYADDAKVYTRVRSISDCLTLNDDFLNIVEWMDKWQMKINVDKCEILSIGHNNPHFPYRLDNVTISNKVTCRDLGIYVSNDLSFSNHCDKISRTAHFRRRQFEQSFAAKDKDFQVFFYFARISGL